MCNIMIYSLDRIMRNPFYQNIVLNTDKVYRLSGSELLGDVEILINRKLLIELKQISNI